MSLVPCPECRRHVRRSEEICPFCIAAIAERVAAIPERRWSSARLGRAALISLAAAGISTIEACSVMVEYGAAVTPFIGDGAAETGGAISTGGQPSNDSGARDAEADAASRGGSSGASPHSAPPRRP